MVSRAVTSRSALLYGYYTVGYSIGVPYVAATSKLRSAFSCTGYPIYPIYPFIKVFMHLNNQTSPPRARRNRSSTATHKTFCFFFFAGYLCPDFGAVPPPPSSPRGSSRFVRLAEEHPTALRAGGCTRCLPGPGENSACSVPA